MCRRGRADADEAMSAGHSQPALSGDTEQQKINESNLQLNSACDLLVNPTRMINWFCKRIKPKFCFYFFLSVLLALAISSRA